MCLIAQWFIHASSFSFYHNSFVRSRISQNFGWHRSHCVHKMSTNYSSKDENDEQTRNIGSSDQKIQQPIYTKKHSLTVCMVPPPRFKDEWAQITKARTDLRDPGLFRWPPHANILYPFIDILEPKVSEDESMDKEIVIETTLQKMQDVIENFDPFTVSVDSLGTFGGKNRGVLYLNPRSFRESSTIEDEEPLVDLQSALVGGFPDCNDQKKGGKYTPHMTLSHFPSLDSALEAKAQIEQWWKPVEFVVDEIYFLKREGDGGQFKIVATLQLGNQKKDVINEDMIESQEIDQTFQSKFKNIVVHNPPLAFLDMPIMEEDWVHEERMKLKARRNENGNRGRRRSGRNKKNRLDRGPSKSTDTPEEIARKRAERAAKKERLAREVEMIEKAIQMDE